MNSCHGCKKSTLILIRMKCRHSAVWWIQTQKWHWKYTTHVLLRFQLIASELCIYIYIYICCAPDCTSAAAGFDTPTYHEFRGGTESENSQRCSHLTHARSGQFLNSGWIWPVAIGGFAQSASVLKCTHHSKGWLDWPMFLAWFPWESYPRLSCPKVGIVLRWGTFLALDFRCTLSLAATQSLNAKNWFLATDELVEFEK